VCPEGKIPPVAEPADVGEVRRGLVHPGHLWVVDECQSRAALAEHLGEIRTEPAPVAHLDGEAEALGQTFEEVFEDTHSFDFEGWRELQEEWS
jgi:hypothetical protein